MRLLAIFGVAVLAGCSSAPVPVASAPRDSTADAWYSQTVEQVADLTRKAESLFKNGKGDEAAALITQAKPLADRLVAVSRPTLAAVEAASDLDHLYARMLLSNRNYGWARLLFQKNLARWKNWQPQTAESARRLQLASAGIADCDRQLDQ